MLPPATPCEVRKGSLVAEQMHSGLCLVILCFTFGCGSSSTPRTEIDFGAELTRLTLERQPHDADAVNGWPMLAEIARGTRERVEAIDRREWEAERAAEEHGDSMGEWKSLRSLVFDCDNGLTAREAALRAEILRGEEQAGTFERLREVRAAEYFCADYTKRLTGDGNGDPNDGVRPAMDMRGLGDVCLAAMMQDLERGDERAALQRLEDAYLIARALGHQASFFHWLFMPAVEDRSMDTVL